MTKPLGTARVRGAVEGEEEDGGSLGPGAEGMVEGADDAGDAGEKGERERVVE